MTSLSALFSGVLTAKGALVSLQIDMALDMRMPWSILPSSGAMEQGVGEISDFTAGRGDEAVLVAASGAAATGKALADGEAEASPSDSLLAASMADTGESRRTDY